MGIHHLSDADLADLDAACQARACVAVQHGALPDALSAGLQKRIFFCVYAETGGQPDSRAVGLVTSRAAAVSAVSQATGRTVVSCADDSSFSPYEDTADAAFHAVGPMCRQRCQRHKVCVPTGSHTVGIGDVELSEGGIEMGQ